MKVFQNKFTPQPLEHFSTLKKDSCTLRERSTWLAKLTETVPSLELDRVIGLVPSGPEAVAYGPKSLVAYTASRFVVLYDPHRDVQQRFLCSLERSHTIGCVAFSRDGCLLAGGELGQQPSPAVLVWRIKKGEKVASRELRGHKYGVAGVSFSHEGELIASVGSGFDGQIIIWNWEQGLALVKHRAQVDLTGVAFTPDSKKIVTSGKEQVRLWVLQSEPSGRRMLTTRGTLALVPKPAMHGVPKNVVYVDVKSTVGRGIGGVCAVSREGSLCLLWGTSRVVDKQINLNVAMAFGLAVSDTRVACACSNGIVKLYTLKNLGFLAQLPFPEEYQSRSNVPALNSRGEVLYPDALSCAFHFSGEVLCVIYSNRTMIFWDVKDKSQIRRLRTVENHSGAIYDIVPHPAMNQQGKGTNEGIKLLFASCSSDGTARVWTCEKSSSPQMASANRLPRPASSADSSRPSWATGGSEWKSTSRVIHVGGENALRGKKVVLDSGILGSIEGLEGAAGGEGTPSLRTVRISPDGDYMAVGDDDGVLRVYELHGGELVMKKSIHNGPLSRLSFSNPQADDEKLLLASGGTDGQVALFDMDDFDGEQVMKFKDHHQKDISGVSFAEGGRKIVSCGRDRYMTFRSLQHDTQPDVQQPWFHNQYLPRVLQYDMSVNDTRKVAMSACSDRKVRMWCLDTGTLIHTFETSKKAEDPIRIVEGPIPTTVVCCHSNATVCLYEYFTGQLLANATGHSESLTGAAVVGGGSHLVTSGTDGCIFVWRIREEILHAALATSRKEGIASETGLVAPMCEEMRSKLPIGTECPATPSRRRPHPSVTRMKYEARLAPRLAGSGQEANPPGHVPRLNLKGIGAGPPEVVKIAEPEVLEIGSSVSPSSQSKKSSEQKDSDSSKDTWTGGASSTVVSSQQGQSKKLLRKDQAHVAGQKSTGNLGGMRAPQEGETVEPGQMPAGIEQLAYPKGDPVAAKSMGDYIDDYNRPRVLQWVKDHAQQTIGGESDAAVKKSTVGRRSLDSKGTNVSGLESRNIYKTTTELDFHHRAAASTPISEKKQRTKWCIPELPKSPASKQSPRYPWSEKSDQEGSICGNDGTLEYTCNNMELQAVIDEPSKEGKAPWSETTESDGGKEHLDGETGIVDSYDSETSFHGALVRAQMSCGALKGRIGDVKPQKRLVAKVHNRNRRPLAQIPVAGRPTIQQESIYSTEAKVGLVTSSSGVSKRNIIRKSSIPKRSNRQSSTSSSLDSWISAGKGTENSFGYRKSCGAKKLVTSSAKSPTEGTVEENSRNNDAKLSAGGVDQAVAHPEGTTRSTSTKAYCNPIYDLRTIEDEGVPNTNRSAGSTGGQKAMRRIGVLSPTEDAASRNKNEHASRNVTVPADPSHQRSDGADSPGHAQPSNVEVQESQRVQHRRLRPTGESLGSSADPPKSFFGKQTSTDGGDDPPGPLAIGSSPRDRCIEQCSVQDRPLSAPPPAFEQLYADMEYLPAVRWSTNSKDDISKGLPIDLVSAGGSVASSLQESERLEPPHSVDTVTRGGSPRIQEQPRRLFSKEKSRPRRFEESPRIDSESSTGLQDIYLSQDGTGVPIDTRRVCLSKGIDGVAGGEDLLIAWENVVQSAMVFGKAWKKIMAARDNTSLKTMLLEDLSQNLFGERRVLTKTSVESHPERFDEGTQTTGADIDSIVREEAFKRFQCKIDQAVLQMRCDLNNQSNCRS